MVALWCPCGVWCIKEPPTTTDPSLPQKKNKKKTMDQFSFSVDALKSDTTLAREAAEALAREEAAAAAKVAHAAAVQARKDAALAKAAAKVDPEAIYAKRVKLALSSNKLTPSLPSKVEEAVLNGLLGASVKMSGCRRDDGAAASESLVASRKPEGVLTWGHLVPLTAPPPGKYWLWHLQAVCPTAHLTAYASVLQSLPDAVDDAQVQSVMRGKGWLGVVKDAVAVIIPVCRCGVVGARLCALHDPIQKCASCPTRLDKRNLRAGKCPTCFGRELVECDRCGLKPRAHSCEKTYSHPELLPLGMYREVDADRGRRSDKDRYVQLPNKVVMFCPHCPMTKHDKHGVDTGELSCMLVRTLPKHLSRAHPVEYPPKYRKRCCGKVFTESFKYKRHRQSHSSVKRYQCSCGAAFKYSEGRSHHLMVSVGAHAAVAYDKTRRPAKRRRLGKVILKPANPVKKAVDISL